MIMQSGLGDNTGQYNHESSGGVELNGSKSPPMHEGLSNHEPG